MKNCWLGIVAKGFIAAKKMNNYLRFFDKMAIVF